MPGTDLHPFALDEHPGKADPALIEADVRHFARIEVELARQVEELEARLEALRRAPGGRGQAAMDRDLEIHRLTARLRLLRRFGLDLCLGRMTSDGERIYIGRLSVTDDDGEPLLVGWRAPEAEPFFGATLADPMGLVSRRRYRWSDGRITDYWDEAFTADCLDHRGALDDQSAFIASLGASRSPRMRDVLGTIQADQDSIIRADARGALVVAGGPGTGKTVVALHRAAYLLHADQRLQEGRGDVLFVGPSPAYLAYVEDVLPSLGEEGVRTCTLDDLVPEGRGAESEADRLVARLKADGRMADAVERAVRLRERVPQTTDVIETAWGEVEITAEDWTEAFGAADPSSAHNEAREDIWQALLDILVDQVGNQPDEDAAAWDADLEDPSTSYGELDEENQFDAYGLGGEDEDTSSLRRELMESPELRDAFDAAWPLLDPVALVREMWASPTLLRQCAPWLTPDEADALQRPGRSVWTHEDLPLLDAARLGVGDPESAARALRARTEAALERAGMDDVVADLIATDDSEMKVMSMLRGQDLRGTLARSSGSERSVTAGPFAHIVVDEAQELTDAQWRMLLRRNPSRSFTIVGDRAQARRGFTDSWQERLAGLGLREVRVATLDINYRTPSEVMAEAEPVIREALPDASVPTSVRSSGLAVRRARVGDRDEILRDWLSSNAEGIACVIGDPSFESIPRVHSLDPAAAKGLEFDLVVLVDPGRVAMADEGDTIGTAVDRYVAMTRATRELVILAGD